MQKYLAFIKKFGQFFQRHGDDDRSLMEKLRDKYRMVIMNDETFEEVTSLKLTPLNVYIFFSSLVVGTAFIVVSLIIYTPLKRYIPGYGDFERDAEIAELTGKVRSLEKEMDAHRRYNDNIRKLLSGNLEDISKSSAQDQVQPDSTRANAASGGTVATIDEDESLRRAVENGSFTTPPAPVAAASIGGGVEIREVPLGQLFFMPAVTGNITAPFDLAKSHFGIDIAAPRLTAIKAAADGMVISADYNIETGYSIAIQHPNNVVTMYKHNSVLLKKSGSAVKAGEAIAIIGNTGEQSSGPHLHFELWHKGRPVNPGHYINFR